jgi:hypothetical protein
MSRPFLEISHPAGLKLRLSESHPRAVRDAMPEKLGLVTVSALPVREMRFLSKG